MDTLLSLISFAFASSITPGPNNMMLSASGIAFGWRRTMPHLFGVVIGFVLLLVACASGVGALVASFPVLELALKVAGSAYLLRLAWTMRNIFAPDAPQAPARPLRLTEAALFQLVNPKAWIMGLTAASVFVPRIEPRGLAIVVVCGVFALVNLPCVGTWTVLGAALRRSLALERWRDYFRLVVGVLMLYAVVAIWLGADTPTAASGTMVRRISGWSSE